MTETFVLTLFGYFGLALSFFLIGMAYGVTTTTRRYSKRADKILSDLRAASYEREVELNRIKALLDKGRAPQETLDTRGNPPPPPHIRAKLDKVSELSQEIGEMIMTLDGPLRGALDAKHRASTARQIRAKQEEVQTLMREVVESGYDPNVMMMDQYGNQEVRKLSDVINLIKDGPEELKAFDENDVPYLGVVREEDDDEPTKH